MGRPRQVSDAQLLDTARTCFLEKGPGVSTAWIAAQAGVSQAVLFKRFGNKRALMYAALMPDMSPIKRFFETGPDHQPLPTQLRALALAIAAHSKQLFPRMAALKSAGVTFDKDPERIAGPMGETLRALAGWFARAAETGLIRRDGDPFHHAVAFFGAVHTHSFMTHITSRDPEQEAVFLLQLAEVWSRGLQCQELAHSERQNPPAPPTTPEEA